MFTPRSARARQVFARVPGRSSISMANSFVVGMLLDLHSDVHGTRDAFAHRELRFGYKQDNTPALGRGQDSALPALNARLQNRTFQNNFHDQTVGKLPP